MKNGAENYRRYLSGDDGGLADIITAYKDPLILFILRFVENIDTAEDICEDVFVKLAISKPHYSKRASFKTWLFAIARNTAVSYLRRHKHRLVPLEDNADYDKVRLETEYITDEDKRLLHAALEKLSDSYRQVLWLQYFEELSLRDIGKILGKSENAVSTLSHRARAALKEILEKEGFVYENC